MVCGLKGGAEPRGRRCQDRVCRARAGNGRGAAEPPTRCGRPSGSAFQEVPVQGSQEPVPGEGSQQPERPQETLIHNGIWAKRRLLQQLSSQDIPKKPLERWGGKFLEVFG